MTGGTYSLVVALAEPATITVGALGERPFDRGWYAYAGTALGPGGFARLDRHRAVAAGENDTRHWHVDYLLGHAAATVDTAVRTPGVDGECAVAAATPGEPVPGVGASDCACSSHLVGSRDRASLIEGVEDAHAALESRPDGPG